MKIKNCSISKIINSAFAFVVSNYFHSFQAKVKGSSSLGTYSSRRGAGMTEDILREAGGSMLTMSMIGCLPDNVQQVGRVMISTVVQLKSFASSTFLKVG